MKTRVTFIGAGEIGRAVAALVHTSGAVIHRWDKDVAKVPDQRALDEIVPSADVLFLCVNSWHLRDAVRVIAGHLNRKTVVVSLSKGLERETRYTVDRLLANALPKGQPFALLSGPMLAEELEIGLMGAAALATSRKRSADAVCRLFSKTRLRLEPTTDLHGTALAGVLKNVYSISLGIVSALEMGGNAKGWFVQRIVGEMTDIVKRLNRGNASAVLGPAGLGDLVCTGFSSYSSNHRVGREIVEGRRITKPSEGLMALPSLIASLGRSTSKLPLLMTIKRVVVDGKNAKKEFDQFTNR
ncbi:MAG TPA: 2-dehydropantoate 2-reductase N-terminal domain-containing protein [Candidatus Methylomirabilis sp.]|nr:2-dehydropantoate 2-reductase N-terminal domain-containing protein [Candidatus Methylomirabilis sp.]